MEKSFFVIFLLTGFYAIPVSSAWYYYFIKKNATFHEAYEYCTSKYHEFHTIKNWRTNKLFLNISREKTDKVWAGVLARALPWTGMDGQPVEYSNWKFGEPNGGIDELCALMGSDGKWQDLNCSSLQQSVCFNGSEYILTETKLTWMEAAANCEAVNSSLVQIQNSTMNEDLSERLPSETLVWIGLNRSVDWYLAGTEESVTFLNWQEGQPDNLHGNERCAAMESQNGTWTDEQCAEKYYFFCRKQVTWTGGGTSSNSRDETKVKKSKLVVKLKMQSTANMEDPKAAASLERQLRATLAKQGVTDFKLSWRKLPEKET